MARSRSYSSGSGEGCAVGGACGCWLAFLLFNLCLGGVSLQYCLECFIGKGLDQFWVAALLGLFLGEFTVPIAIICFVLKLCGVHMPFFPNATG